MARIQVKLDKEDSGLSQLAARLSTAPRAMRIALVVCDCSKIERDMDTGGETVTVRISQLEEVPAAELDAAVKMLHTSLSERHYHHRPPGQSLGEEASLFPEGTIIDLVTGEIFPPEDPTLFDMAPSKVPEDAEDALHLTAEEIIARAWNADRPEGERIEVIHGGDPS